MRLLIALSIGLLAAAGAAQQVEEDAAYFFSIARLHAADGENAEAAEAFERALELQPDDPYIRIEWAEFLSQTGRLRAAAEEADRALEISPENLEALRLSAFLHLELAGRDPRSVRRAREAFETLRERDPEDVAAMLTLSRVYLRIGEISLALDVLEEAEAYTPGHPAIRSRLVEALAWGEEGDRAEDILRRLVEQDSSFVDGRVALAERLSSRGEREAAISLLDDVPVERLARESSGPQLALELYRRATETNLPWAQRRRDLERAGALIESFLEQQPGNLRAFYLRALVLAELNQTEAAVDQLQGILAQAPEDMQLQVAAKLSELLEHEGRIDEAQTVLSSTANQLVSSGADPLTAARLWLELAHLGVRQGGWQDVARAAERVQATGDEGLQREGVLLAAEAAMRMERYDDALALLAAAGADDDPRLAIKEAEVLLAAGRNEEGLDRVDALIATNEISNLLAAIQLFLDRDDQEAVLPVLERAADAVPPESDQLARELLFLRLRALADLGRAEEALILHDEALAVDPPPAGSIDASRMALARVELLDTIGREQDSQDVLDALTENADADTALLLAQHFQGAEAWTEMSDVLETTVASIPAEQAGTPRSLDLKFALGMAYERDQRLDDAERLFRDVLSFNPEDSRTLNYLGYTFVDQGIRLEEGLDLIQRAVALDPRNGAYLDSLGWAYYQLGRYEEAIEPLETAARLVPDDATILEHMGDLYLALDQRDKARDLYTRAMMASGDVDQDAVRRKLDRLQQGGS